MCGCSPFLTLMVLQVAWNYGANFGGKTGNNPNWTGGADTVGYGAANVS